MSDVTKELVALDKQYLWHPFTQMQEWCAPEHKPLILERGDGACLFDSEGNSYIDGNASIWTNLHGHRHPRLDAALQEQLEKVAHTSFLGFTNPPAARLAKKLVQLFPENTLSRVFYSDNGSTAIEVALKMAVQYWQLKGQPHRKRFVAFSQAYHGDTFGASSLGGIPIFHDRFSAFQFPVNLVADMSSLFALETPGEVAAVVIEPLIQGAAGMRLWPCGMLKNLRQWCDEHGVLLITDEVMTGFGRTGTMFACEREDVIPDMMAVAKGLTGGYMPLAATLVREFIYEAFLGIFEEQKTFYYGHSYTGNQLGCALALANLEIFEEEQTLENLATKIRFLQTELNRLRTLKNVIEVRECGFMAGIELAHANRESFAADLQMGAQVCMEAREYGLLTRAIRNVIVLMPPYCVTEEQIGQAVDAIAKSIEKVCSKYA